VALFEFVYEHVIMVDGSGKFILVFLLEDVRFGEFSTEVFMFGTALLFDDGENACQLVGQTLMFRRRLLGRELYAIFDAGG
jgi:hypothetical protein